MKKIKVFITSAGAANSIACYRSLISKKDIEIILGDENPLTASFFDKKVKAYQLPLPAHRNYIKSLLSIIENENVDVFIPMIEEEIYIVTKHRQRFEKLGVKMLTPEHKLYNTLNNKYLTNKIALKNGIEAPKTFLSNQIGRALKELSFPMIVKPCFGAGAQGVVRVFDRRELNEAIRRVKKSFGQTLIQEFIPGEVGTVYGFCCIYDYHSRLKGLFLSRFLKANSPLGGPALAAEPINNNHLRSIGIKFVEKAGNFIGPALVEFKKDSRDGRFKFLEINSRIWGHSFLATGCGINFPEILVKICMKRSVHARFKYRMDRIFIRNKLDIIIHKSEIKKIRRI